MVIALSRFGSFSRLETTHSSSTDQPSRVCSDPTIQRIKSALK
jgi:hypothetical protein